MRITHLSTHDLSGGAARAAYRLHTGLLLAGHESRMLVLEKSSSDPTVLRFGPPRDVRTRLRRGLQRRFLERHGNQVPPRPPGASFFSDDRSQHGADVLRQLPPSDILNLHWAAGLFDYRAFFRALPRGLPVIWTLHDMNPFTGGCHFDDGCGRYTVHCGQCPQLGSSDPTDFSSGVWSRKKEAYSEASSGVLHLVTPSRWLEEQAKASSLLVGYSSTVIPYGVDTGLFRPSDVSRAKEQLKIPQESSTVLFVADSIQERRKGFGLLVQALRFLKGTPHVRFLAVGRAASSVDFGPQVIPIDYIEDEATLSLVYSAADVFVVPSLQDNLPNTALEALACGVPTVAFDAGGLRDIVQEGQTGHLVPVGNIQALRAAIEGLLTSSERRALMSAECRRRALAEYRLDIQASRYAALCETLVQE